ncbi:MAG: sugar transferase, partial [Candidatus Magasanikbacteria bacterium]|nr:sugar transferase [Candidatus Magasanikbacteria bacterium]
MKRAEIILMILQVPVDFCLLLLAAVAAYAARFTPWAIALKPVLFRITLGQYLEVATGVAVVWLGLFALAGLYRPDPNRRLAHDLPRVVLAVTAGLAIVAVYAMFTEVVFDSRFLVAASWFFAVVFVSVGRVFMWALKRLLYRAGIGLRTVYIIGQSERVTGVIAAAMQQRPELGYALVGTRDHFDEYSRAFLREHPVDEILLTNPRFNEADTLDLVDFCNERHITLKYSGDLFDTFSLHMRVQVLAGIPVIELRRTPLDGWGRVVKRSGDIVGAVLGLLLTSPFLALAAIIIFFETGRPVIYRNERVGIRGQHFWTLKFRSMYQRDSTGEQFGSSGQAALKKEAELIRRQNSRRGPIYKIANDPRVTPFGRFIRRWSIDELPQLWNVFVGEMSLVGPRPHQPR